MRLIPIIAIVALAGCQSGRDSSISGDPYETSDSAGAATPNRAVGSFVHDPNHFNEAAAASACVNDLRVYQAYLQAPDQQSRDLSKPVNEYIRDAGGAEEAIEVATVNIASLNNELDRELANRNPFNAAARNSADDNIARIEDGILLNEVLIEALRCHV